MEKIINRCYKQWMVGKRCYRNHDLPALIGFPYLSFEWYGFQRLFNLPSAIAYYGEKFWYKSENNKIYYGSEAKKIITKSGIIRYDEN